MAENTIDNLSIQVTASADKAASVFDRLASSAGRLRGAAQGAAGGLHEVGEAANNFGNTTEKAGKKSEEVGKDIRSVGKAAKDAGDNAKKGASGLATFWQSLKRIAFYRFIRSVIKEITSAFSEGIKNLYHWSDLINGHFAASMDRLATSSQYLKNSLGAMVSPLIETLIPVLDVIIDKVVDVLNFFNMLVSAVSGADTYTVAKKAAAVWNDSANKTRKAAKSAADDIKRTILGFDEINKLVDNKDRSSGGGSGSSPYSANYKNMFEERPINSTGFGSALSKWVESEIGRINAIVDVSAMALGLILALHGSPVGFGLLAAGALDMGASIMAYDDRITPEIKAAISGILGIAGIGLAIGAVLAFMGANIPLGLGLMIASIGALGGSYKIASANWDAISELLRGPIGKAVATASAGLLVFGIIALATSHIPLGLGLIVAGAAGLAATASANFDSIGDFVNRALRPALDMIMKSSLVLGIIALMIPGMQGVGAALLMTGLAAGVGSIALQWDKFKELGKKAIEGVKQGWESVKLVVKAAVELVKKGWTTLTKWVGDIADKGVKLVKNGWKSLTSWVGDISAKGVKLVKKGWTTLTAWVGNIADKGVKLVKNGWTTITAWVGNIAAKGVKLVKNGWSTITAWVGNIADKGVKLVKTGWTTLTAWVGNIADKGVKLVKNGWTTLTAWVGNIADKGVKLVKNGWTTITAWVGNIADKGVKLIRDGWTTITAWVGNIGDKGVKLVKNGWTTITAWVGNIADKGVKLVRNGWTTITAWVGNIADKGVKLVRSGWTTITSWVGEIGARSVSLIRSGWTTLADWAKSFGGSVFELFIKPVWDSPLLNYLLGQNPPSVSKQIANEDSWAMSTAIANAQKNGFNVPPIDVTVDLEQGWFGTPESALGVDDMDATVDVDMWSQWSYWHTPPIKWLQMDDLKSTVSVDMWTPWWATNRSPLQWLQMDNLVATVDVVANVTNAQNTIKAATNFSGSYKAEGGVFSDNRWTDIPQYAGGTFNAHGSLFLAGEAGPEIVGHVGGRTEVLNKSQIAAAMYSAVQAAMAPVTATMAYAAQSMGGSGTEIDYTGMYDIIRDAVAQALANDSGSREQTQLLRQISDKDFSAEITTSSMNKAQTRMNRRAGVTLVPVGT